MNFTVKLILVLLALESKIPDIREMFSRKLKIETF